METESSFLAALEQIRGWKISGRQLDLMDASGKTALRFSAQPQKAKS
jgi:putative lipoprotein